MYPSGDYAEIGTERWEIETHIVPKHWDTMTEAERDEKATYDHMPCIVEFATTLEAARIAAKAMYHRERLAYGAVTIQRQVAEWMDAPYRVGEWVNVGETEYEDGEA